MKLKAKCRRVLCFMLALMMLLPAMNASAVNFKPISSIDKDGKPVDLKLRSKACRINKNLASQGLNVLNYLGLVERVGKKGNSFIYKVVEK